MIPSYSNNDELLRLAHLGYQHANDSGDIIEWILRMPDLSDYMRELALKARASCSAMTRAWESRRLEDWNEHDARNADN